MESSDVAEIKRHFNVVADGLEEKMERGFDEVKAMIRFSYAEPDRRVVSLEAGPAKLEAR